jgi:hypothetical protein
MRDHALHEMDVRLCVERPLGDGHRHRHAGHVLMRCRVGGRFLSRFFRGATDNQWEKDECGSNPTSVERVHDLTVSAMRTEADHM